MRHIGKQPVPVSASATEGELAAECELFTRYLLGRSTPESITRRYVQANGQILDSTGDRVVAFVMRHRWALPYLDAACGLRQRDGALRAKLLMLTAILETTPEFADHFLPEASGRFAFIIHGARQGTIAVLKAAVGLFLLPWVAES